MAEFCFFRLSHFFCCCESFLQAAEIQQHLKSERKKQPDAKISPFSLRSARSKVSEYSLKVEFVCRSSLGALHYFRRGLSRCSADECRWRVDFFAMVKIFNENQFFQPKLSCEKPRKHRFTHSLTRLQFPSVACATYRRTRLRVSRGKMLIGC